MSVPSNGLIKNLIAAARPKQWTKNGLVFAAYIFALGDRFQSLPLDAFYLVIQAALSFCLVSSGVYILNDIRDVDLDRNHPKKCKRPIASGALPVKSAFLFSILLFSVGLLWGFSLDLQTGLVLTVYFALQIAYTLVLKQIALVDLFVIASGFVLRALCGALVIDVVISPWLLLCTLLLALFLALCKRRHEKVVLTDLGGESRPSLEQYDSKLLDQLISIVSAATIVCYAIYTLWPDTVEKFGTTRLGLTIPFVIFGLFRYLDLVYRHEKGDRPEQILLTDRPLMLNLFLYATTVALLLLWKKLTT